MAANCTAQVAEPADPQDGNDIPRPGAAVSEGVEGGDAGAHQGRRLHRGKLRGDGRQRRSGDRQVVGVTAVKGDAGDQWGIQAGDEITPAAGIAVAAVAAVPPHPHPLADLPAFDPGPQRLYQASHFVARHPGVGEPGEAPLLDKGIRVADPAGLDPDQHPTGARLRAVPFHQFEWSPGAGNLHRTHFCHVASPPAPGGVKIKLTSNGTGVRPESRPIFSGP